MYPVLFRIGSFEVQSFWVMVVLGFTASWVVARAEMRRLGHPPEIAYDLILWAYIGGFIGARLFLVLTAWDVFVKDPFAFLFSGSGWVWQGGIIGGTVAVILGTRQRGLPLGEVADTSGLALAIGQAVGRIGCQLAGDGDYGTPSSLPWAMSYPHGVVPTSEYVHPAPVYEMLLYLLIFMVLWRQRSAPRASGSLFAQYLIFTGVARFAVEFVRINPRVAWGLTIPQLVSLVSVAAGVLVYVLIARPAPVAQGA